MTPEQEAVREATAKELAIQEGWHASDWDRCLTDAGRDRYRRDAELVLSHLSSLGVMIAVEEELPEPDKTDMCREFVYGQEVYKQKVAGYVKAIPLVED